MKINKLLLALSLAGISTIAAATDIAPISITLSNEVGTLMPVILQTSAAVQSTATASSLLGGKAYAKAEPIIALSSINYENLLIQPNPMNSVTVGDVKVKTSDGGAGSASATGTAAGLVIFPVSAIPAYHDAFISN
jgi:hypothetical protein